MTTKTDLTAQVQAFCDLANRYALALPWRLGPRIIATDGRVLVSCDPKIYHGDIASDDANTVSSSGIRDIVDPIETVAEWQSLPELPPCVECGGTGRLHVLDEDDGPCRACVFVAFGRRVARDRFLMCAAFPGCEIGVVPNSGPEDPIYFRFTNGCAVLSPLSPVKDVMGVMQ